MLSLGFATIGVRVDKVSRGYTRELDQPYGAE